MTKEKEIYDLYAGKIHRLFSNKAAAANDIDDLLHTTFLRFYEKSAQEEIRTPLRYLYRIAHNVLYEYWRKRRRDNLHQEIGELSLADLGAGITTLISNDEERQRVLDALRHLRLDFQIVIELRYWERLSYQEIAELLDQNPRTIGVWLRRGRHQLHKLLLEDAAGVSQDNAHRPSDEGEEDWPGTTQWDDTDDDGPSERDSDGALSKLMDEVRAIASKDDEDPSD